MSMMTNSISSLSEHTLQMSIDDSTTKPTIIPDQDFVTLSTRIKVSKKKFREKNVQQLIDEILNVPCGKTICCSHLSSSKRYKLHKRLSSNENENGFFTESRGPRSDRCMYIWRKQDVIEVLCDFLPYDVVCGHILPRLITIISDEKEKILQEKQTKYSEKTQSRMRIRNYYCDECGCIGTANSILVSVYHPQMLCEDCIENDEDYAGSKWEDALPYYS